MSSALKDLPEARRVYLLRHYGWKWGFEPDDVARFVAERAADPCQVDGAAATVITARLGSDGRYHLSVGGRLACAARVRGQKNRFHHRQVCSSWLEDGYRRFTVSRPPDVEDLKVTANWTVDVVDKDLPADSIAVHLRCPVPSFLRWPRFAAANTPIARIRAALIETFGPGCALCGTTAQNIDHDHDTGMVRGLLCERCNVIVDLCPHVDRCPAADYLTHPPARALAIAYPNRGRKLVRPKPDAAQRSARREEVAALHATERARDIQ